MAVEEPDDALDEGQMHHPHFSEQGDYEKLFYSEAARENKLSAHSAKVSITKDNPPDRNLNWCKPTRKNAKVIERPQKLPLRTLIFKGCWERELSGKCIALRRKVQGKYAPSRCSTSITL